jgi:hypothetical protein
LQITINSQPSHTGENSVELEVNVKSLTTAHLNLISSITSTKLERIILAHLFAFRILVDDSLWMRLDDVLVRLVERLTVRAELKVEFRHVPVKRGWERDWGKRLPMFVEKGRMTVFDLESQLIYCSDAAGGRR